MSVAAVAARDKAPIILTDGKTMPMDPDVYLYVIGGEKAVYCLLLDKKGLLK